LFEKEKEWIPACAGMTKKEKENIRQDNRIDRIFFNNSSRFYPVILSKNWIPAFAGMTWEKKQLVIPAFGIVLNLDVLNLFRY